MKSLNVTIINPPLLEKATVSLAIPMGVAYLAGYLRGKGINIQVIDAVGEGIFTKNKWDKDYLYIGLPFEEIISKISPKVDFITVATNFSTQQRMYTKIIEKIREKFPKTPLIVGGNDPTMHPDFYLNNGADYAVLGEGEGTLYELIEHIANGKDYSTLDGISFRDNKNEIVVNKKTKFIENLDEVPFPARDLLPLENYWKRKFSHGPVVNRFTSITSSRGCPLTCSYCASIVFWQRTWRARSPKNFVDEIEECVTKHGITHFEINDDNFTLNMSRAVEICNEIIKRGLKITWTTPSGVRPEKMNEENLKLFKESGCVYLIFAPESGSQRLLKEVYNKFIDLNLILKNVEICHKIGIRTGCFMITGLYAETQEDFQQTLDYVKKLAKSGLDEICPGPMLPYPNTPMTKKYFSNIDPVLMEQELAGANINDLPDWYPEKEMANKRLTSVYKTFYQYKTLYHPIKQMRMMLNILTAKQETKTERSFSLFLAKSIKKLVGSTAKAA